MTSDIRNHLEDTIDLGGIVTVRDRRLEEQAHGRKINRLESGDTSFAVPEHIGEAIKQALRALRQPGPFQPYKLSGAPRRRAGILTNNER